MAQKGNSQAEVTAFLSGRGALEEGAVAEVVETHGALVFLTQDTAYKMKRAVRYGYLDYSTPRLRREMLARELELNKGFAPGIYRDLVPVTRNGAGALAVGGKGAQVEWLLRMRRFAASDEMSNIAARGDLTADMARDMGVAIASYHAASPRREADGAALIEGVIQQMQAAFADMEAEFGAARIAALGAGLRRQFEAAAPILRARAEAGHVRRCHGDLHLRNIVLMNGVPTPFDALEFDERLGTCDTLYDLAFLLMDMMQRGLMQAANQTLNSYIDTDCAFDPVGLRALPLFLGLRAAIRAMVGIQAYRLHPEDRTAHCAAESYLDLALSCLAPARPRLVAVGGLSGTGKTTIARAVAHRLAPAPGARHLRSDVERKRMFGVAALDPLPDDAYAPEVGGRVYARLRAEAGRYLGAGISVIMDATHLSPEDRAACEGVAAGVRFDGIWLEGRLDTLKSRVDARRNDASDADAGVLAKMATRDVGVVTWARLRCDGPAAEVAARVWDRLAATPPED
ncbi:AAA family ATPase [Roseovarius sp. S4756]|uniref:bifunctional aminoglycoside phosphotransferase/ATP-binding protein n=1 Tax=Roseovarius maritimus TaxID=3342637 RepID=UPI003B681EB7